MATSLIKFANRTDAGDQGSLHWGRVIQGVDNYPFRGKSTSLYTEEEFRARVVKTGDPKNGVFDVTDPESNRAYLEVLDGIVNGWFQCLHRDFDFRGQGKIYIEWVEYYLEDGTTRTPYQSGGVYGQQSFGRNPPARP